MAYAVKSADDIQALFCKAQDNQTQLVKDVVIRARDLTIAHVADPNCWKWIIIPYLGIEAAELIEVSWLQISGEYPEDNLTPGKQYEVNFVLKLKDNLYMGGPVKLTLDATGEKHQEHEVDLMNMPRNNIINLTVGKFEARTLLGSDNTVYFSLTGKDDTTPKTGLLVLGVNISPVN